MFQAAALGLKLRPFSPIAGVCLLWDGPLLKLSKAFVVGKLFTPFGLVSSGVTVDVDAEYVLEVSIFTKPSSIGGG